MNTPVLKTMLPLVFAFVGLILSGQNHKPLISPGDMSPTKAPLIHEDGLMNPDQFPISYLPTGIRPQSNSRTETEVTIGRTQYDLQTNSSIANRFFYGEDGTMAAVWTMGFDNITGFYPDRGTGFNDFDGNDWGDAPVIRLENNVRTGWPNYVRTNNGTEFIINHVFTAGEYRLHYLRREAGIPGWTEGDIPTGTPFGVLWPRAVVGGQDGETIHMIAITTPTGALGGEIYKGVNMHILYYRSPDGGQNWDVVDGVIPGLDSTLMADLSRADSYALDARGDVVTLGVFSHWNDIAVFKSTNNGNDWTRTRLVDFPIDKYVTDMGYSEDDLPPYDSVNNPNPLAIFTSDASGAIIIDNDDMVHAFFGEMYVMDDDTTDGTWSFFPCSSGIYYWNEGFGPDSVRLIAGLEDLNGNDVFDVDCQAFDFGRYGTTGLTTFPSVGIDAQNNLFLAYCAVMEGEDFYFEDDQQHYRHIYMTASLDGGETWTDLYDIVNEDIHVDPDLIPFTEAVYPHVARHVDSDVRLIYQQDFRPGLSASGDEDPAENNFINFVQISVTEFGLSAIEDFVSPEELGFFTYPNPASGEINLSFTLKEKADVSINVFDILGREIKVGKTVAGQIGQNTSSLNIGELPKGVYLVKLKAGNLVTSTKIFVH